MDRKKTNKVHANDLSRISDTSEMSDPDALKYVSWVKAHQSFLVEFNDGVTGMVSMEDLRLQHLAKDLIPNSVRVNERGNAAELFKQDGELFDIDGLVLKSFLSEVLNTSRE